MHESYFTKVKKQRWRQSFVCNFVSMHQNNLNLYLVTEVEKVSIIWKIDDANGTLILAWKIQMRQFCPFSLRKSLVNFKVYWVDFGTHQAYIQSRNRCPKCDEETVHDIGQSWRKLNKF